MNFVVYVLLFLVYFLLRKDNLNNVVIYLIAVRFTDYIVDVRAKLLMVISDYRALISLNFLRLTICLVSYYLDNVLLLLVLMMFLSAVSLFKKVTFTRLELDFVKIGFGLAMVATLGTLFSSLPRILTDELYNGSVLATVGALLYVAGLSSQVIAPTQNKIKAETTSEELTTFFDLIKIQDFKIGFTIQILSVCFVVLTLPLIVSLLIGSDISLTRHEYALIAIASIIVSFVSYYDVYLQLKMMVKRNIELRISMLFILSLVFYSLAQFNAVSPVVVVSVSMIISSIVVLFYYVLVENRARGSVNY